MFGEDLAPTISDGERVVVGTAKGVDHPLVPQVARDDVAIANAVLENVSRRSFLGRCSHCRPTPRDEASPGAAYLSLEFLDQVDKPGNMGEVVCHPWPPALALFFGLAQPNTLRYHHLGRCVPFIRNGRHGAAH